MRRHCVKTIQAGEAFCRENSAASKSFSSGENKNSELNFISIRLILVTMLLQINLLVM